MYELIMINLGMIDIYKELIKTSKALQNVEQLLWTIIEKTGEF